MKRRTFRIRKSFHEDLEARRRRAEEREEATTRAFLAFSASVERIEKDSTAVVLNKIQTMGLIAGQIFAQGQFINRAPVAWPLCAVSCAQAAEMIYDRVVARIKERGEQPK